MEPSLSTQSRPKCSSCNRNVAAKGKKPDTFRSKCSTCSRGYSKSAESRLREKPLKRFKKKQCESCGFVPVHACQLDVDHKDGDKNNNSEDNFMTLCANCHRLKTHMSKDYLNIAYRSLIGTE